MIVKKIVFLALTCGEISSLHAAYQEAPPPPVVQYKPQGQKNLTTVDSDLRKQMNTIDQQIQQLTADREELRLKAKKAGDVAENLMQQYQEELAFQQSCQQEMQKKDDAIAQLVRKKSDISKQIKK